MSAATEFATYRQAKGTTPMDDIFGLVETLLKGSSPTEREHFLDVIGRVHGEPKLVISVDPAQGGFTDAAAVRS
jgi:hypothetical protein